MHERSLIAALIEQASRLAAAQGAASIEEVRVRIGPLSGIEPVLAASAFGLLAPASAAAGARLIIEETPLTARCRDCGASFEIVQFRFRCPECQSQYVQIFEGDALMLESITIRPRERAAETCLESKQE